MFWGIDNSDFNLLKRAAHFESAVFTPVQAAVLNYREAALPARIVKGHIDTCVFLFLYYTKSLIYWLYQYNHMREAELQVRKWGRSMGVVIPKTVAIQEHIKSGDTVKLLILKKSNPIKKTFGTFKFKKNTEQMLKEADEEAWNE